MAQTASYCNKFMPKTISYFVLNQYRMIQIQRLLSVIMFFLYIVPIVREEKRVVKLFNLEIICY